MCAVYEVNEVMTLLLGEERCLCRIHRYARPIWDQYACPLRYVVCLSLEHLPGASSEGEGDYAAGAIV